MISLIKKWYEKTGYFGFLCFQYALTPFALVVMSILISAYTPISWPPMSINEALLYTVVVRVAFYEYKIKRIFHKGTKS